MIKMLWIGAGGFTFSVVESGKMNKIEDFTTYNKFTKILIIAIGIVIGIITLIIVRNFFAVLFGFIITAVIILTGIYVPDRIINFILRLIGLTSMIYVPLDIVSDTIYKSHIKSDVRMLADEIGGSTIIWGGIWLIISLIVLFLCLRCTLINGFSKTLKVVQK